MPDPGFPIYESMTRFIGATPVALPLRGDHAFRPDPDELRSLVTDRTRLIVLNSPNNPTGSIFLDDDLEAIADVARERDLIVLSDEIYGRIVYEGEHRSIASLPGMAERTIILDGFSKAYAMTGWRLGYGILPEALVAPYERLMINTVSCTASYAQVAAVEALTGPQDASSRWSRSSVDGASSSSTGLAALPGVRVHRPGGAFYAFPDVSGTGMSGAELAERLLLEAGVSVLAGTAFGGEAPGSIRISYANSQANLRRALERMATLLRALADAGPVSGAPTGWADAGPPVLVTRVIPEAGLRIVREACAMDLWEDPLPPPRDGPPRARPRQGRAAVAADRPRGRRAARRGRTVRCASCPTSRSATTTSTSRPARVAGVAVGNTPGVLTETTRRPRVRAAHGRRPAHARGRATSSATTAGRPGTRCSCSARTSTVRRSGSSASGASAARSRGGLRGFGMRVLYHARTRADGSGRAGAGRDAACRSTSSSRRATS